MRLFAFELRRWEAQLGPSARSRQDACVAGIAAIFRRDDPAAANPAIQLLTLRWTFPVKRASPGSAAMEFELIDTGLFDFLLRHHRASPDIESVAGCLTQECRWWVVG